MTIWKNANTISSWAPWRCTLTVFITHIDLISPPTSCWEDKRWVIGVGFCIINTENWMLWISLTASYEGHESYSFQFPTVWCILFCCFFFVYLVKIPKHSRSTVVSIDFVLLPWWRGFYFISFLITSTKEVMFLVQFVSLLRDYLLSDSVDIWWKFRPWSKEQVFSCR